ncbi:esterase-like activity of phytase family protein [Qipengyuania spongiae]|uniref:Esterase-like activity of phytase family protein n=1 Tax=Qipengyuania spongiae TaxID=2909673 RepID=A0ABY5T4L4_9SPHN|nr:esterase-like activity of phytase family protein [Qipengyuania spongiae]UVI39889.1 esterase-like activity of phytase family protein [Qipengyuania spongiae]
MLRRRLAAATLVLALAPGLWLRTPVPTGDDLPPITLSPLAIGPAASGPFRLLRGWELTSDDPSAGGYSALLWRGGDRLLAASDTGRMIELEGPDFTGAEQRPIFTRGAYDKVSGDIEALAGEPGGGRVWAAAEGRNAITRASSALVGEVEARPPAMAGWRYNSGPESLARLPDGRFVVVAESARGGTHMGVLFAGDPVADPGLDADGAIFGLAVPDGFRPVDAVPHPDGTLLVLLRKVVWKLPPGFATTIARYRIADLAPGRVWRPVDSFALPDGAPTDNYEGIALRPESSGTATVWLISDDNRSGFQRSLLLEFAYDP